MSHTAPLGGHGQGSLQPGGGTQGDAAVFVLDTNIVLDLWVFNDPLVQPLREKLALPDLTAPTWPALPPDIPRWVATSAMRDELACVLTYPHLVRRQALDQRVAQQVLAAFDHSVTLCPVAPKARFTCTDGDDQKFIDLAAAQAGPPPLTAMPASMSAVLISKDKAVLRLKKRLATLGVWVGRQCPAT